MSIADAFGDKESTETELPQGEQTTPEPAEKQEPAEPAGAPPAPDAETKHVPLAALEAERKGRQDWKEKAIRFEEETKQLRREKEERERSTPREPQDPLVSLHETVVNERFNTSEMLARDKHADLDEKVDVFMAAANQNPALAAQMQAHRHPWDFAYQEGKRLQLMQEMGTDPDAYRKKVRDEVMAEIQKTQPSQPAAPLPQSLAGARSSGARGAVFTGPTPLESLFPN